MPYARKSAPKRTYKKRYNAKRPVSAKQVKSIAKSVLFKATESKQHTQTTYSLLNLTGQENLYHNQSHMVGAWANLMRTIPGLEDSNGKFSPLGVPLPFEQGSRIGEQIFISGLSIKFLFTLPADRSSVLLRIMVLSGADYDISQAHPIIWKQDASLMHNVILDRVDTKRQKIVAAKNITLNHPNTMSHPQHNTSTTTEKMLTMWIPFKNKRYSYSSVSGTEHHGDTKSGDYCLSIAAYDKSGALITDVVAKVACTCTMYFKDP